MHGRKFVSASHYILKFACFGDTVCFVYLLLYLDRVGFYFCLSSNKPITTTFIERGFEIMKIINTPYFILFITVSTVLHNNYLSFVLSMYTIDSYIYYTDQFSTTYIYIYITQNHLPV